MQMELNKYKPVYSLPYLERNIGCLISVAFKVISCNLSPLFRFPLALSFSQLSGLSLNINH